MAGQFLSVSSLFYFTDDHRSSFSEVAIERHKLGNVSGTNKINDNIEVLPYFTKFLPWYVAYASSSSESGSGVSVSLNTSAQLLHHFLPHGQGRRHLLPSSL